MAIGKWSGFRPVEIVFSLLALVAIFAIVDVRKIYGIILSANLVLFLAGICVYSVTLLIMSYRIRFVLANLGEKIKYADAFASNLGGMLASDFTPARTGYFATPVLLSNNYGIPLDKGVVAIVSPQIAEFFLKAAGASAAILLIASVSPLITQNSILLWGGIGIVLLFCAIMWAALFFPWFVRLVRRFEFLPYVRDVCDFISLLQTYKAKVKKIFPAIFLFSVAIFLTKGVEWWFYGQALGVAFASALPQFLIFLLLQPLVTIFQFVPIPTVAGLGLSEAGAVASMSMLGVPVDLAIVYALLIRAGTSLVNALGIFQVLPFIFKNGASPRQP